MKILVTGANGFIGRNIKSILPQEAEVISLLNARGAMEQLSTGE